jgi:hypothetical protein
MQPIAIFAIKISLTTVRTRLRGLPESGRLDPSFQPTFAYAVITPSDHDHRWPMTHVARVIDIGELLNS